MARTSATISSARCSVWTSIETTFRRPKVEVHAALEDKGAATRHLQAVSQALDTGMFGAPWFVVDGEPFWGHDRLDYLDRWLGRAAAG